MTQKIRIPQWNCDKALFVVVFQRLKVVNIRAEILDLCHAQLIDAKQQTDHIRSFKKRILENKMLVGVFTVRIPCVVFMYQMMFFDQQHFLIHRHHSFLRGSISTHSTLSRIPTFLTVWFSAILRHLISDNQSAHSTLEKHLIDIIS